MSLCVCIAYLLQTAPTQNTDHNIYFCISATNAYESTIFIMHIEIIPSRKVIIFFVTLGRHMPLMVLLRDEGGS